MGFKITIKSEDAKILKILKQVSPLNFLLSDSQILSIR